MTDLIATTVWSRCVSPGGDLIGMVYDTAPKREVRRIVIYHVKEGIRDDIDLPDKPSRIINECK